MKSVIYLLFIFASSVLFAGEFGKIIGKISDLQTGEPLIGANVHIKGTKLGATTDTEGEFYIIKVPPGTYSLNISYIGYSTTTIDSVVVIADQTTKKIKIQLLECSVEGEAVTVIAEAKQNLQVLNFSASIPIENRLEHNTEEYSKITENDYFDVIKSPIYLNSGIIKSYEFL